MLKVAWRNRVYAMLGAVTFLYYAVASIDFYLT